MAFKQSNNPISRKTSPLRSFTMGQLNETTTAEAAESKLNAKTLISKDDPKRFAGDDEGRLQHQMSPEEYDDKYTAPSRKASPLNDESKDHPKAPKGHMHGNMKRTVVDKNKKSTNESPKKATEVGPTAPSRKASPLNDDGHFHAHTKKDGRKDVQENPQIKKG